MIRWDPTDDIEVILAAIRELESGGRYTVRSSTSSASGAYQYITSTWNHFGGYRDAYVAPPVVQDAKARADVVRFLSMFGGDVSMVPVMWYYPRAASDASWMDRVPHPEGNSLTVRQYQQRWLRILQRLQAERQLDGDPESDENDGMEPAEVTVLADLPQRAEDAATFDPTTPRTAAGGAADRSEAAHDGRGPRASRGRVTPADEHPTSGGVLSGSGGHSTPARTDDDSDGDGSERAAPDSEPSVAVGEVTVSEETLDWAARSVPPLSRDLPPHGEGSQRSIVFPVLGPVTYADGWGDCRGVNCGRRHEGTDIIGVRMQPLLPAVDGTVHTLRHESRGTAGVILSIIDDDGWRYNYFHNNNDTPGTDDGMGVDEWRFPPGLSEGDRVTAGQIVGYMGDSGNSEGSVPHLHFEFRDPTGAARPSYWSLKAAEARQACMVALGPWSFPHEPGIETDDEVENGDGDGSGPTRDRESGRSGEGTDGEQRDGGAGAEGADPGPTEVGESSGGGGQGEGVLDDAVTGRPTTLAELIAQQEASVERGVEMTSVTPLFGGGQWLIDTEGRVTATGDAALIIPSRTLECEPGPITPHGADAAGWHSEPDTGILQGTVLDGTDLTGTELAALPPHDEDDSGDLVIADDADQPDADGRGDARGRTDGNADRPSESADQRDDTPARQGRDTDHDDGRHDQGEELAAYKDLSTDETIIVLHG